MTASPDAAAAQAGHPRPAFALIENHHGAVITVRQPEDPSSVPVTGVLKDAELLLKGGKDSSVDADLVALSVQEDGKGFLTIVRVPTMANVTVMVDAPPSPHDTAANVGTPEHLVIVREMAEIADRQRAIKGEGEGLAERYAELADKLMDYFALAGDTQLPFDGRLAHVRVDTFAQMREKPASEGGGRYTNADVVEALRAIERVGDIKPESVNTNTLGAILREYRDAEKPVPPELDAVVELGERPKIVIGASTRKRR